MRKFGLMMVASIVAMGVAAPAMAHPYDAYGDPYETQHDYDHERLDQQHDSGHDYLDDVHSQAHEEGMTPWEHRQLHRDLDRMHRWQHRQLDRQHSRQHWNNDYDGYGGYGGYGGNSGYYGGNNGYYGGDSGFSIQFGF
jgi:hypothetical protein